MALEALDGWLIIAVHNFPSTSQRGAGDIMITIQDMLKVNQMIRSARSIVRKLKIRSISLNHQRFMRVHVAAHATVEGGASQQAADCVTKHASRKSENETGNTTGRERGQEGFVKKRVRADHDEASLFQRNVNTEVRTML